MSADGQPVGSPDDFRRLLRRKQARAEELALEVRRDDKPVRLIVPLKD